MSFPYTPERKRVCVGWRFFCDWINFKLSGSTEILGGFESVSNTTSFYKEYYFHSVMSSVYFSQYFKLCQQEFRTNLWYFIHIELVFLQYERNIWWNSMKTHLMLILPSLQLHNFSFLPTPYNPSEIDSVFLHVKPVHTL